nr:protein BatD [candidate division Zixibacteria bacterium]
MIILCLIPGLVLSQSQDEVKITMTLSKDVVNLGEQAYLSISVSGPSQNLPQPELPNLSMFDVYSQGTSTNISIVNGKMESSVVYNFILQPRKEGTMIIKPAVIVLNRKRYESNEVTLKVLSGGAPSVSEKQAEQESTEGGDVKDVFLTAEVDKKNVYVNEQITLSIKFYHAVNLYTQPDYTPPQTTDFWAEAFEGQNTYYQVVGGQRYKVIELRTALFPTRSGELTIGQGMVSVDVPSRTPQRRTDPFSVFDDFFTRGEKITVRSKALTVQVKPLPEAGKPTDFSGNVGNFKISSSADKTTVDVNQPVTVTYRITGTGNIKTVAEPKIGDLKDFRVYNASSDEKVSKLGDIMGGTKTFEEVYIPRRAGKLTIPPVEFSFFDLGTNKYKVLSTTAINLNVQAVEESEYADLPYRPVAGKTIDPNARDIRFIKIDPGDLSLKRPLIIFRPAYFVLNALPVALLLLTMIITRRREKFQKDIGYARSRAARKMARKRLTLARKLVNSDKAAEFYSEIRRAIFSYIADKLNISPHGITGDRLIQILRDSGCDETTLDIVAGLLHHADFAQYSSVGVSRDKIIDSLNEAEKLLVKLEGIEIVQN